MCRTEGYKDFQFLSRSFFLPPVPVSIVNEWNLYKFLIFFQCLYQLHSIFGSKVPIQILSKPFRSIPKSRRTISMIPMKISHYGLAFSQIRIPRNFLLDSVRSRHDDFLNSKIGAPGRNQALNQFLTKELLYQLSYRSMC